MNVEMTGYRDRHSVDRTPETWIVKSHPFPEFGRSGLRWTSSPSPGHRPSVVDPQESNVSIESLGPGDRGQRTEGH